MFRSLFVLTLSALFCTNCVSVRSNTKAGSVPTFQRLLVVLADTPREKGDARRFLKECPPNYTLCTASFQPALAFDSLSGFITEQNKTCQAEVALIVRRTGPILRTDSYNRTRVSGQVYQIELQQLPSLQPFWKAEIQAEGTGAVPVTAIFKRLSKDGILQQSVASR
ncbi:hypothetical protein [Siphonobacter sp.]|uniref:hypothetical protein n=1 Tax=Siphonobacter sp. TaxID=1869184 RepID=UPI003B3A4722